MFYVIIGLIGGIICALIALNKRRSAIGWFAIGFLIPLIGIILLVVLPPVPDPNLETADLVPEPGPAQFAHPAAAQRQVAQSQVAQSQAIDSLHKLVELKDRGALTQTEFEEGKQQLLQNV